MVHNAVQWCTMQVGGEQRRSVVHDLVLHCWGGALTNPHKQTQVGPILLPRLLTQEVIRQIITSRVSGRGHRIGAVFLCVCVCVCLSVCL